MKDILRLAIALTLVPALLSLMTRWGSRRGILARLPLVGGLSHTFSDAPPAEGFFSWPPSTVTKLGQNPLRHEKSLLHEDRLMRRLRPNSVSSGNTDRQFDSTLQSPQPSHTSGLMNTRVVRE